MHTPKSLHVYRETPTILPEHMDTLKSALADAEILEGRDVEVKFTDFTDPARLTLVSGAEMRQFHRAHTLPFQPGNIKDLGGYLEDELNRLEEEGPDSVDGNWAASIADRRVSMGDRHQGILYVGVSESVLSTRALVQRCVQGKYGIEIPDLSAWKRKSARVGVPIAQAKGNGSYRALHAIGEVFDGLLPKLPTELQLEQVEIANSH